MVYISIRDDNAPQSLQHCLFLSEAQNIGALDRMCAQSARNIVASVVSRSIVLCCVVLCCATNSRTPAARGTCRTQQQQRNATWKRQCNSLIMSDISYLLHGRWSVGGQWPRERQHRIKVELARAAARGHDSRDSARKVKFKTLKWWFLLLKEKPTAIRQVRRHKW